MNRLAFLFTSVLLMLPTAASDEISEQQRQEIVQQAAKRIDGFWHKIEHADLESNESCRKLFSTALVLCEARVHPERLSRLFDLAQQMQDRDPQSPGFGNFRWYWRDSEVTDRNAAEFCMEDAALIWHRSRDWIPEPARGQLQSLMQYGLEGCFRHQVRTDYTNIAILNCGNLIQLGELLDRPDVAEEGYRRLDAIMLYTWQFGTHEYCSPTYYAPDLSGLLWIEAYAKREQGQRQARALAELLWTDVAANWLSSSQRIAGPQSRSYDYLRGLGGIDQSLWRHGWIDEKMPAPESMLHWLCSSWSPPQNGILLSRDQYPRLVRQSWGESLAQSRTHQLYHDVSLGISSAGYGQQDLPMTVDLAGSRETPHAYFIADGREDPYGRNKYATGSAGHMKALHLTPFWTGAQRGPDALGVAVYREKDLPADLVKNIQSHFVLRRDADAIFIDGQVTQLGKQDTRFSIPQNAALVLRYGTAAVGIRVVWSRTQSAKPSTVELVDDGRQYGVVRLTVEHQVPDASVDPGVAVWVRIGSDLDDQKFDVWRKQFETSEQPHLNLSGNAIEIQVNGVDGPVSVATTEDLDLTKVRLIPEPTQAVLEVNGVDVGRTMLESLEPIQSYRKQIAEMKPIDVPASGGVYWEAEQGILFPRMCCSDDPDASNNKFIVQPADQSVGNFRGTSTWQLSVARAGKYRLWGRVFSPDKESDSFYISVLDNDHRPLSPTAAWHTDQQAQWTWRPVKLERSREVAEFDLPQGTVQLVIGAREFGAKLDRLFLTSDPHEVPQD